MRVLISAYNINSGGGKLLLESLLDTIEDVELVVFADKRLKDFMNKWKDRRNIHFEFVKPSVFSRVAAEYKMSLQSSTFDKHLCLGNLPPLFSSRSNVSVYLHSRYMLDKSLDNKLPLKKLIITNLERFWFSSKKNFAYQYIVQTPTMKFLLIKAFGPQMKVEQIAFAPKQNANKVADNIEDTFIYVASFDPHKNHALLIEAWRILARDNSKPKLTLVLPTELPPSLMDKLEGLNVEVVINQSREDLNKCYSKAQCLIHPSIFESLGLVLLEAKAFGLDIIAPEADYVRDVVEPVQTFDPHSELSISRSVKRYLRIDEKKMVVESPTSFWKKIL